MKTRKQCLLVLEFSNRDNPTEKEIKSRFRKLSIQCHPDKGGDAVKYKEISIAYEKLLENKFELEQQQDLPNDLDEKLISKISSFLDNCADTINVTGEKIIFKLINNNIVCIKIETTEEKTILVNNYLIKIKGKTCEE